MVGVPDGDPDLVHLLLVLFVPSACQLGGRRLRATGNESRSALELHDVPDEREPVDLRTLDALDVGRRECRTHRANLPWLTGPTLETTQTAVTLVAFGADDALARRTLCASVALGTSRAGRAGVTLVPLRALVALVTFLAL